MRELSSYPRPSGLHPHAEPHSRLLHWLVAYQEATPGTRCGDNATVRLDLDNEPQPDALLLINPALGGQARISEDDFVEGPAELVAEVASSSVSYDLHSKLHVYRRSGVREYLVWRTLDQAIDWFVLRDGQYETLAPDGTVLKSEVFPGLWLDAEAILGGNLAGVLETLRLGMASPEHVAFRERCLLNKGDGDARGSCFLGQALLKSPPRLRPRARLGALVSGHSRLRESCRPGFPAGLPPRSPRGSPARGGKGGRG